MGWKKKKKRSKTGPTKSLLTFSSPHPSPYSVLSSSLLPTPPFKSTCTSSPSSSRIFFHPSSSPVSSVTDTPHQLPLPVFSFFSPAYIIPRLLPLVSPRPHTPLTPLHPRSLLSAVLLYLAAVSLLPFSSPRPPPPLRFPLSVHSETEWTDAPSLSHPGYDILSLLILYSIPQNPQPLPPQCGSPTPRRRPFPL